MSRWQPCPLRSRWRKAEQDVHHRRQRAAGDVGDQRRRHHRPVGRPGVERQQSGMADVVEIVPGLAGARAGLAVAGDRAIDQLGIDRAHRLIAEPQPRHHAGAELLDQHIGAGQQRHKLVAIGLVLEIEHEALLAAVEQREHRALAVEARLVMAHVLAARPLDLDHLGAGLRQQQRGERPRQQRGEIEHENAGQRLHETLAEHSLRQSRHAAPATSPWSASRPKRACRAARSPTRARPRPRIAVRARTR